MCTPAFGQDVITQADLLHRVIDLDRLTTPPVAGEVTGMFSSYDRRSGIDARGKRVDWDANNDWGQFLRREGDWDVMAEIEGPGALTRVWSANPHGDIRFILDGKPVIDTTFDQLLSGELAPFKKPLVDRGLLSYFPIGFNESCKVVCRNSTSYYQINYVRFPAGTQVARFESTLDDDAQAMLKEVEAAFVEGLPEARIRGPRRPMPVASQEGLGPGDTLSWPVDGAGTVRALYIALTDPTDPRDAYALHKCILRVFVDGSDEPSVEAPLVDFFGSGFDLVHFNSLPIGTFNWKLALPLPDRRPGQDRFLYCFFPMPFQNGLRLEIQNLNETKKKLGLLLYMQVDTTPPAKDALRFNARFRKEDPCQVLDYPILKTAGRGRLVGCVLNVDCPRPIWWGEGDEKVWIDGEAFPSYFGTGSEGYVGDAWGLHEFFHPLCGVTRTGPYGKNSAYRWHIPDAINFQKSIEFTIENWQFGGVRDTYYSTVVYWYGEPREAGEFSRLTLEDVTPPGLRVPGAIEVEDTIVSQGWGHPVHQRYTRGVEFSKEYVANVSARGPVRVKLHSDHDRTARLGVRTNPRNPFETITVQMADRTVGTVKYGWAPDGVYTVGVVRLQKGDNELTIECTRAAQLDCWVLEDVPKNGRGPEGEELRVVSAGGAKTSVEYATLNWSDAAQLAIEFPRPGSVITFALPDELRERTAALRLLVSVAPRDGRFQALLNGEPVGEPFETYAGEVGIRRVYLGPVVLKAGENTLGFKVLKGTRLGLDVVELAEARSAYALECEDLAVTASERSNHGPQAIGGTSGEEHLWCRPTRPRAWVELAVPVPKAGKYNVSVVYTQSMDYGVVQAYVNGNKVGRVVDTYATKIAPGLVSDLGPFDLPAGTAKLRIEVTGRSDASTGYFFGVDCVELRPAG